MISAHPILARGPPVSRDIAVTKHAVTLQSLGAFFLAKIRTVRFHTSSVLIRTNVWELLRYGAPVLAKSRGYADRTDGIAATPLDAADFDHPPSESVRRAAGAFDLPALAAFSLIDFTKRGKGRGGR